MCNVQLVIPTLVFFSSILNSAFLISHSCKMKTANFELGLMLECTRVALLGLEDILLN